MSKPEEVKRFTEWFAEHYGLCDDIFHLSGQTFVGKKDETEVKAFKENDLRGPVSLVENMRPHMSRGSTMNLVTSLAAAVPETRGLEHYAAVKGGMVKWCAENRQPYGKDGINVMLIAMGAIGTEVGRNAKLHGPVVKVAEMVLPPPEKYSQQILTDAMERRSASYPGLMAELGEFKNGEYRIKFGPLGRKAVVTALEIGTWLMKNREGR